MQNPFATDLPISAVIDDLRSALSKHPCTVLQAAPGAGKTTCVPLALLDEPWLGRGKIYMLAPRRLAARAAARRMAALIGESVGQTVGYRVRLDTRVGPATRIEVMTEGVLTRMLQSDPSLKGVGLVIFDEFHERSLDADLGLALCLDVQGVLNDDLRLLVMSATMETRPVAALLDGAPVIEGPGRAYPVETRYVGRHTPSGDLADVTRAILSAVGDDSGSILVFLPGAAEIRQVSRRLNEAGLDAGWRIAPLLGRLDAKAQDRAIAPAPDGCRKIVLATAIAETSLTIDGIRVVVDSGLQRVPRYDVRSGMTRLTTIPVSKASANQRRGRAGRMGPGLCLRLWSRAVNAGLVPDRRPEIMETDLCRLALELARWGVSGPEALRWLDPPPEQAYASACELLTAFGALDDRRAITRHGRGMAAMPVHPRLAHMLLMSRQAGHIRQACDLAALLTERDLLTFEPGCSDADLQLRLDVLNARRTGRVFHHPTARPRMYGCDAVIAAADQLYRLVHRLAAPEKTVAVPAPLIPGQLLAWAYPDRIARRRPGPRGRYLMAGGQGLSLDPADPLAAEAFIVAAEVDGRRRNARIFRAAAYSRSLLEDQFARLLQWRQSVRWDNTSQAVAARRELYLGALPIRSEPLHGPDPQLVADALLEGISAGGIEVLPWNKRLRSLQMRICFLHRLYGQPDGWPDLSDACLIRRLDRWLGPYLAGMTRMRDVAKVDLRGALLGQLNHAQRGQLDRLAPSHWTVPSGSRIPIDYSGAEPVLAVRLQEMFGCRETPAVAGGRQKLLLHLLSPAGRPVQVTRDLAGFWRRGYHEVKKELKGRYPKHYWPDDPVSARPTARAKPRK